MSEQSDGTDGLEKTLLREIKKAIDSGSIKTVFEVVGVLEMIKHTELQELFITRTDS